MAKPHSATTCSKERPWLPWLKYSRETFTAAIFRRQLVILIADHDFQQLNDNRRLSRTEPAEQFMSFSFEGVNGHCVLHPLYCQYAPFRATACGHRLPLGEPAPLRTRLNIDILESSNDA